MARLLPFRSEPDPRDGPPRIVDLEGEDADAVFSALSSATARQIYAHLDEEPATPSDLAEAIDSSIQNVRYHLEKLDDAGLIEVVDTWYSSRGNEMSVYATTTDALIVTGDESVGTQLKTALSRLVGGIGALAGGSLVVQYGATRWLGETADETTPTGPQPAATDDSPTEAPPAAEELADDEPGDEVEDGEATDEGDEPVADPDDEPRTEDAEDAPETVDDPTAFEPAPAETTEAVFETVPPGLVFFLGGLVVLLCVFGYWYWYRPSY